MKIACKLAAPVVAAAALVLAAASFTSPRTAGCGYLAGARAVDDPPPVECPLCGGNADLHNRILAKLAEVGATSAGRALLANLR